MTGTEFIRKARRYARKTKLVFDLDTRRGKGSHQTVYVGEFSTLVQHGEIGTGTLLQMLKDLNIDRRDF